ncbi:MAG: GNAT family N-acetyltransferase [Rhizobiaceae bacterium]
MRHRPTRSVPVPSRPRLALIRSQDMPVAFYRYLYEQVGRDYHWYLRRVMDDAQLAAIIHAPTTEITVLYANGNPAGFIELDTSRMPDEVELAYFGICRGFTGMGIGRWFLNSAIEAAWAHGPGKVTVHTNTLDHPAALSLYQKLGFEPVATSEETVTAWE